MQLSSRVAIWTIELLVIITLGKDIAESLTISSGQSAVVYNLSQFVGSSKGATVFGWVGTSKSSYCFLGLNSISETLELCTNDNNGVSSIYIKTKSATSEWLGSSSMIIDEKNLVQICRFYCRDLNKSGSNFVS